MTASDPFPLHFAVLETPISALFPLSVAFLYPLGLNQPDPSQQTAPPEKPRECARGSTLPYVVTATHGSEPTSDQLDHLFRAAVRAADHGLLRPWRFLIIRGQARSRLGDLLVAAANRKTLRSAPLRLTSSRPSRSARRSLS